MVTQKFINKLCLLFSERAVVHDQIVNQVVKASKMPTLKPSSVRLVLLIFLTITTQDEFPEKMRSQTKTVFPDSI